MGHRRISPTDSGISKAIIHRPVWDALAAALLIIASVTPRCHLVDAQIRGSVPYPKSTMYTSSITSYYDGQQRALGSDCIFRPINNSGVSQFVKLMTASSGTQFAVRCGGHTLWTVATTIDDGITVDMRLMDEVVSSGDHKIPQLGSGGIWSDVYPQIVPHNLTVIGGGGLYVFQASE